MGAWNANPSRDLGYTSLVIDEQNRSHHAHKITDTARFRSLPSNGNLAALLPAEGADEAEREALPRYMRANTNTRTVFADVFYEPKEGIADLVADPSRSFAAVRAAPHVALNELASTDPRIRRLKPSYEAPLGPGHYDPDPLREQSTGTLAMAPGEVHRGVCLARDPTRPSAVFVSAARGRTAKDIADESVSPPITTRMTEPDFAHWTRRGCAMPRGERRIEAERWGRNCRERRPPAEERPQNQYMPTVITDGHAASCTAYTSDRMAPAYKTAFSSGLPRTLALPLGNRPDTRLVVRSYDAVTAAGPDVGPGAYNPEALRLRSPNAAYDASDSYYSLASGAPAGLATARLGSPRGPGSATHRGLGSAGSGGASGPLAGILPPALQHQLAASSGSLAAALFGPSAPGTPRGRSRGIDAGGALAAAAAGAAGLGSEPSSPSALRAAAQRAERAAAAALVASASALGLGGTHPPPGARGGGGGGAGGGGRERSPMRGQTGPWGAHEERGSGGGGGYGDGYDGGGGEGHRARSAPVAPRGNTTAAALRNSQARQFNKLVFMQRHTPCASLLRSHLAVAADLRQERQKQRNSP